MLRHNMSGTPEYKKWQWMKGVCYNKSHQNYPTYGGRGIRVQDSWKDNFLAFYKDMGKCPDGHVFELINLNADFSKHNCRWVHKNKKRPLKDMPNQKKKGHRSRLYKEPVRVSFAVNKSYYDFLQKQALQRSQIEKKMITVNVMVKELVLKNFQPSEQLNIFSNKKGLGK